MSDVILAEYRAGFEGLKADSKAIQSEYKAMETAGVKAADTTTKAFTATEDKTKSLKAQLRTLKEQLANATDPKDVQRLSKEAGILSDKINDANESVKVFASGSKFQQIGNAFGTIVSNIRAMDFQRANEQSKVLVSVTKSLTFKEALTGVKDLGTTLLNVGKSLLLNPLFLIPALIGGIIQNFDKLKAAGGIVGATFQFIGKYISFVVDTIKSFANAVGLINSQASDFYDKQKESIEKAAAAQEKTSDRIIQILKAQGRATVDIEKQKYDAQVGFLEKQKDNIIKAVQSEALSQEEANKLLTELGEKKAGLLTEYLTAVAANNKKEIDEAKKKNKELADEALKLNKILRDLRTGNITNDFERDKQELADKLADDVKQYHGNAAILIELKIKYHKDLQDLEAAHNKKIQDENDKAVALQVAANKAKVDAIQAQEDEFDKATSERTEASLNKELAKFAAEAEGRKQVQKSLEDFISTSLSSIQQLTSTQTQGKIQDIENAANSELAALDNQYKRQLLTKEQYEARKTEITKKSQQEEAKLKRRQFEIDKQISLAQAFISGAQAVVKALSAAPPPYNLVLAAISAAAVGLQIANIAKQQPPKFGDGGKVPGKLHSEGGTDINAERDEFIVRRTQALKHDRMLRALNSGQIDSFIQVHYIAPALKEQQRKNEEKAAISVKNVSNLYDGNLLESLKQVRRASREDAIMIVKALEGNQRSKNKW